MERRPEALVLGLVAVLSIILLCLALASTVAAFGVIEADATLDRARTGDKFSPAAIRAARDDNLAAAHWFDSARYRMTAMSADYMLWKAGSPVATGKLEEAIVQSLAAAPASPYQWTRLAEVRLARRNVDGAVRAWTMAVMTGRYVPQLMEARLLLGFQIFQARPLDMQEALDDQIRVYARTDPRALARLTRALGAEALVRSAVRTDPELMTLFNDETNRLVRKLVRSTAGGRS